MIVGKADPDVWTPSHMRLSPSKINTYKKCPREFYYKYIAKLPEKKTIHFKMAKDLFMKLNNEK